MTPADEGEPCAADVTEVNDDDGIPDKVHLLFDRAAGVNQLRTGKIADEDGVLKPLPVRLHNPAHLP